MAEMQDFFFQFINRKQLSEANYIRRDKSVQTFSENTTSAPFAYEE